MRTSYQRACELYAAALRAGAPADRCHCCGAQVAAGVQGCFELFAQVGMRGHEAGQTGRAVFYGVDAHALQHPEIHGKKNNAAHLLRLHWLFAHNMHDQAGTVPRWWQHYLAHNAVPVLAPPPPLQRGTLTVADVAAHTPAHDATLMQAWAAAVYHAWEPHHAWAARELARVFAAWA